MQILFENVSLVRNSQTILQDINLQLDKGKYVILGPNGSGKTSLLSILCGWEWPSSGKCYYKINATSYTPARFKKNISVFFPKLSTWIDSHYPAMNVLEVICSGLYQNIGPHFVPGKKDIEIAVELTRKYIPSLKEKHLKKNFSSLSTGEKYRTLLLRSVVNHPKVLILDEPFDALDIKGRLEFESFLGAVSQEAEFTFLVLHRIEEIPDFATQLILMKDGKIFDYGEKSMILKPSTISSLYEYPLDVKQIQNRYFAFPLNTKHAYPDTL